VAQPLTHVYLCSRGPGGVACGMCLWQRSGCYPASATFNSFHLFSPGISPSCRPSSYSPEAVLAGQRSKREALERVTAYTLRVSKSLAALALQCAIWRHVGFHCHSQNSVTPQPLEAPIQ
jgi:hypothetical protein